MNAETMLLIDHGKGQVVKIHILLKQGMGTDEHMNFTGCQIGKQSLARSALVPTRQHRDP